MVQLTLAIAIQDAICSTYQRPPSSTKRPAARGRGNCHRPCHDLCYRYIDTCDMMPGQANPRLIIFTRLQFCIPVRSAVDQRNIMVIVLPSTRLDCRDTCRHVGSMIVISLPRLWSRSISAVVCVCGLWALPWSSSHCAVMGLWKWLLRLATVCSTRYRGTFAVGVEG